MSLVMQTKPKSAELILVFFVSRKPRDSRVVP